jgi:hypothetical protein
MINGRMEIPLEETSGENLPLSRPQRRLLKRIYNGRTVPIMADEQPFLTYKEAARYLLTLESDARDAAYAQMKAVGDERD